MGAGGETGESGERRRFMCETNKSGRARMLRPRALPNVQGVDTTGKANRGEREGTAGRPAGARRRCVAVLGGDGLGVVWCVRVTDVS